jgi:acetyl esterase/lipase
VLLRQARAAAGSTPLSELALCPSAGLPPLFVSVGGAEIPRDDILCFVERLRSARADVQLQVVPEMPHNPALFEAYHPQGKAAFLAMVSFIRNRSAPIR